MFADCTNATNAKTERRTPMQQITIPLDDQSAARLQELAQRRGETVEQTAQSLLLSTLPSSASAGPRLAPDDPDGTRLIRSLAGSIPYWPGHEGQVTRTTNEDIDRILADEAMNPHEHE
jgi:hypothetical protein